MNVWLKTFSQPEKPKKDKLGYIAEIPYFVFISKLSQSLRTAGRVEDQEVETEKGRL